MNTPSHFLLHITIKRYFKNTFFIPKSFVFGAIAPDILLYFFVLFFTIYSQYILGNSSEFTFRYMFDTLYFHHPAWIFGYNVLHSPVMLLIFFSILYISKGFLKSNYYKVLFWFLLGCFLHTIFDIPLHHDDGPRIFYPFSDYIFMSPISYWDTNYYGGYVMIIEAIMNIVLLTYITYTYYIERK